MRITPTTLTRFAGVAAVMAGLVFIGVQVNHPHLDAESIPSRPPCANGGLLLMSGNASCRGGPTAVDRAAGSKVAPRLLATAMTAAGSRPAVWWK